MTATTSSRLRTEVPGPESRALHQRRTSAVAAGVGSVLPAYITSASGGLLTDADGNTLIDLGSGISVTNVGHARPPSSTGLREQAERFTTPASWSLPMRITSRCARR